MGTIDAFISRYLEEYDFYDQAARIAAQRLESDLRAAGVRSMVTYRAKSVDSLKEKCKKRDAAYGGYKSVDEIFGDIVDLAGVRVALYFPGEVSQVEGAVKRLFDVTETKTFPDPTKTLPGKRFRGYSATHYRVQLKEQDLDASGKRYALARIEIQVASVLIHAWAEVEHDLVYKPQSDQLSTDEYAILDGLNGLVLSGEIALETLQRAGERRVAERDRKISNHYDLASLLLSRIADLTTEPVSEAGLGRIDQLFELITRINKDTPGRLKPYLDAVDKNFEARPLADQIIDAMLAEDPRRYETYESIRPKKPSTDDATGSGREEYFLQYGIFMSEWMQLETIVRRLAPSSKFIMPIGRQLEEVPIIDPSMAVEIDHLRRIRNNLVHGTEVPSSDYLAEASRRLKQIVGELEERAESS